MSDTRKALEAARDLFASQSWWPDEGTEKERNAVALIDAALAPPEPAALPGWQSIESAPQQDDHSFLVRRNLGRGMTCAMQVSRFEGQMYPDHMDNNVDWRDRVTDAEHWMPLPAPPAGDGALKEASPPPAPRDEPAFIYRDRFEPQEKA